MGPGYSPNLRQGSVKCNKDYGLGMGVGEIQEDFLVEVTWWEGRKVREQSWL